MGGSKKVKKVKKILSICKDSLKKISARINTSLKTPSAEKSMVLAKSVKKIFRCKKHSAKKSPKKVKKVKSPKKVKRSVKKSPKSHKKHANPWMKHLASFRKSHPKVKGKQVMKQAKKSYKS
jgi:hypothetical protein